MDDSQIDDVWIARAANGRGSGIEPGNLRLVGVVAEAVVGTSAFVSRQGQSERAGC